MASKKSLEILRREFERMQHGDERLNHRALDVAEKLAARPSASLPEAMRTDASQEGTYRLLGNKAVSAEAILGPHRRCTAERAAVARKAGKPLLAIHDTTEATFGGAYLREGLGRLPNGTQGFLSHVTMLATRDQTGADPLGVLQAQTLVRLKSKGRKSGGKLARDGHAGEAQRWLTGMTDANAAVADLIHVADREADAYWLLVELLKLNSRFIFRNKADRRILDDEGEISPLRETLRDVTPMQLERSVTLEARHPGEIPKPSKTGKRPLKGAAYVRPPSSKKTHPARNERLATLQIAAARITLRRPNSESSALPASIDVNAVRVFEPSPPTGETPIEWFLLTTEPIETQAQLSAIVDSYRARWLIEEFFKALKTGCNYESSQLESLDSLVKLLAFYCPIAWRMLRMRTTARSGATMGAQEVLTKVQIKLLAHEYPSFAKLKDASAKDALLAVAALGGHSKRNGDPGWLTLRRGMDRLLEREAGFYAAKM